MADAGHQPDEAALAVVARHALHDEELIAGLAVDGLEDADEAARARSIVDRCSICRDLLADLSAISGAIRAEASSKIAAPRDYRLSPDDARRLGGTISPRGFLRNLRRAMVSFGRPVGASMATFGLVGVLVGSMSFAGGAASAPTGGDGYGGPGAAPSELPIEDQTTEVSTKPDPSAKVGEFGPASSLRASAAPVAGDRNLANAGGSPSTSLLLGASVALVVLGLWLAWYAARRSDRRRLDPSRFH